VEIQTTSEIQVEEIGGYGGDWLVIDAARVSSRGTQGTGPREITSKADIGLLNALVRQRHTSPFQHGGLTFYVAAPIFVFREWRTHRIAMVQSVDDFAYNETSARYKQLEPLFYLPPADRPMMKREDHKAMRPVYDVADPAKLDDIRSTLIRSYEYAWKSYQYLLGEPSSVAPEIARCVLPVGIYSSMYVSCNPLSLMKFLSLRTHEPEAAFVSYPQWEIESAARFAEKMLETGWPHSYNAWKLAGRVI
jgi:thymidylate synthase (FAD)